MEDVFIAIMEQIAQEMPELSLIDEDYGQLEMGAEEDQYPVTFPCVLIGMILMLVDSPLNSKDFSSASSML